MLLSVRTKLSCVSACLLLAPTFAIATPLAPLTLPEFEKRASQNARPGTDDSEAAMREELANLFISTQELNKDKKVRRGTHSKGICAKGRIEISPEINAGNKTDLIRRSAFVRHASNNSDGHKAYNNVRVRFANAASKIDSDQAFDLRAVSIRISDDQGNNMQEMAMNNAKTFVFPDLKTFVSVTKAVQSKSKLKMAWNLSAINRAVQDFSVVKSYEGQSYWTGVPFIIKEKNAENNDLSRVVQMGISPANQRLGEFDSSEILKTPAKDLPNGFKQKLAGLATDILAYNKELPDEKSDPENYNSLQNNFKQRLESEPIRMNLFVQFLDETRQFEIEKARGIEKLQKQVASELIENPAVEWENSSAKRYKVAELVIESSMDEEECDGVDSVIMPGSDLNFAFKGIGWANRVRDRSEEKSYQHRLENN